MEKHNRHENFSCSKVWRKHVFYIRIVWGKCFTYVLYEGSVLHKYCMRDVFYIRIVWGMCFAYVLYEACVLHTYCMRDVFYIGIVWGMCFTYVLYERFGTWGRLSNTEKRKSFRHSRMKNNNKNSYIFTLLGKALPK